ncbi:MAG TPA: response regulator transcription factor [Jiangellaceae bacterium]
MALRVLFAEDNYLVREGTAALLAEVDDVDLIGVVGDPRALLEKVAELRPDVVLTDIRMPPTFTNEGIDVAKRIRVDHPETGVVVLSQYAEEEYAFELLEDGVAGLGYLLKDRVTAIDELVRAMQEVARGGSVLDPRVVEGLVAQRTREARSPLTTLTEKETAVLKEMATGRNNSSIAQVLFMSERAVEKHIGAIFQKLGLSEERELNRRVAAVITFLEAGGAAP